MNLVKEIKLEKIREGKNSYYDEGGSLIIKNITVFTGGRFIATDNTIIEINDECIKKTDWVDLLQGRPIVEGHEDVTPSQYWASDGTVKEVRLEGVRVVVDAIINSASLQNKILTGELRSVSLSFRYNEEKNIIDYINHLGVVGLGQVAEAVINLEKQGENMEDKEKILNLEKQVEDLNKQVNDFKDKEKNFNLEAEKSEAVKVALEKQEQEWNGTLDVAIQCAKLGLEVDFKDIGGMTKVLLSHKEGVVKQYLPEAQGDLDTLFNIACELQKKEEVAKGNTNEAKVDASVNMSLGDMLQAKAVKGE